MQSVHRSVPVDHLENQLLKSWDGDRVPGYVYEEDVKVPTQARLRPEWDTAIIINE